MKCYIATYYKYDNYGTRLQNFALSQALKEYDLNPITLYLQEHKSFKQVALSNIRQVLTFLPIISLKQKIWLNEFKKLKAFNDFNKLLNFKEMEVNELDSLDFDDAIAIAGSDQIWSPNHLRNHPDDIKLFFLQFVPKNKRYAYAPSFGVSSIPNEFKKLYKANLMDFNEVSVREEAGKQILKDLIDEDVLIVPDPVFLLNKEEWRKKLELNKENDGEKYVLSYFLGMPDYELKNKIENYSKKNGYKIKNVAGNYYEKGDFVPSPDQFVELIDKAELIFTDSFHACAFSIIMGKPFFVFKRNDVKQFSRIETLLNKYDCLDCIMSKESFKEIDGRLQKIDFNKETELKTEQIIGLKFIEKIIDKE